jgi:hypothetical protein
MRRRGIAPLDGGIVDVDLEGRAVDIKGGAGSTRLGDFEYGPAGLESVAEANFAYVDSARGEILSHGSVEERIAAGNQRLHDFGGDQEDGFERTAVNLGMGVVIAIQAKTGNIGGGDGGFRETAARNVDLDYGALHGDPEK